MVVGMLQRVYCAERVSNGTAIIDGITYDCGWYATGSGLLYSAAIVSVSSSLSGNVSISNVVSLKGRDYPVSAIPAGPFKDHKGIVSVTVPENVSTVSGGWQGCSDLGMFLVVQGNKYLHAQDGAVVTSKNELKAFPPKRREKYRVPDDIDKILQDAFAYCSIDSLFIPGGVDFETYGYSSYQTSFKGFKGNLIIEKSFEDYRFLYEIDETSTVTVVGGDVEKASKYCNNVKSFPYWGEIQELGPGHIVFEVKRPESGTTAQLSKVLMGGREIIPDVNGLYEINNLTPQTDYKVEICYEENGQTKIYPIVFTTPIPEIRISSSKSYMGMIELYLRGGQNNPPDRYECGVRLVKSHYVNNENVKEEIKFKADEKGYVRADNLVPPVWSGDAYEVTPYVSINGEYYYGNATWIETRLYEICDNVKVRTWQNAVEVESFDLPDDETFYPDAIEVAVMYADDHDPVRMEELPHVWQYYFIKPGERIYVKCYWIKGDKKGECKFPEFYAQDLGVSFQRKNIGPTTAVLGLNYLDSKSCNDKDKGYMYTVNKIKLKGGTPLERLDCVELTGLEPSSDNKLELVIESVSPDGNTTYTRNVEYSFRTQTLELCTENPRVPSLGSAIATATTNISDRESGVGFQWKKYDAPAAVAPGEGYAAVYDGMAEGYIRNLQPEHYYNLRAFYKSAGGNFYYSDWVTFDPSDFSYFEPIVHTYPVEYTTATTTDVRGYVMPGSDDISQQGFEYWPSFSADRKQTLVLGAPSEVDKVFSTGQLMTARLDGLEPGQPYEVRSFVTAGGETYYGETQSFLTEELSAIEGVYSQDQITVVGYFDMSGRCFAAPQKGLNIVVYSDGTVEKKIFR